MHSKNNINRGDTLIEFLVGLTIFSLLMAGTFGLVSIMMTQTELSMLSSKTRNGATSELQQLENVECLGSDPADPNPALTLGTVHEKDVLGYGIPMTLKWEVFEEPTDPDNLRVHVYRIELTPYPHGRHNRSRAYVARKICVF